jgi:hypothetical protein
MKLHRIVPNTTPKEAIFICQNVSARVDRLRGHLSRLKKKFLMISM